MDNRLNQTRVSYSHSQSQKHTGDEEYVTAVAAAAFSIHSLEMRESPKFPRTHQSVRGREDNISRGHTFGETLSKRSLGQYPRTTESVIPVRHPSGIPSTRPITLQAGYPKNQGIPIQHKNAKAYAQTWEKAKIQRIQKRYEKIKSQILSWESKKKIQAKLLLERKKSELEKRRAIEIQHYKNKIARIDMIAKGAITQLEEQRRKEESKAREKAIKVKITGRVPVKCFCF